MSSFLFLTMMKRHSVGTSWIIGAYSWPLYLVCCHGRHIERSQTQIESSRGSARADLRAGNGLLCDLSALRKRRMCLVGFTRRFECQSKSGAMHLRHWYTRYRNKETSCVMLPNKLSCCRAYCWLFLFVLFYPLFNCIQSITE